MAKQDALVPEARSLRNWPLGGRLAIGALLFLMGLLLRYSIAPQHGGLAFVTFYPVILLSFYLAGTLPGALTAVLSGLAGVYFFIPPYGTFELPVSSYLSLGNFAITSTAMGWVVWRLHLQAMSLRAALGQVHAIQQSLLVKSAAIEAAASGIAVADLEGTLTYANAPFAHLWGIEPAEAIGRTLVTSWMGRLAPAAQAAEGCRVFHPNGTEFAVAEGPAAQALRGRASQRNVIIGIRRPSGDVVWAQVSSEPILMQERLAGIVITTQDITEKQRREAELADYRDNLEDLVALRTQELAQARAAAEAASVAKSAFLANMSHEIRAPMNGVLGMANLLRRAGLNPDKLVYVDKIVTSGRYLLRIIDDILDLAKIEAGKLQLDLQDFSLDDLLRDAVGIVAERIHAKGLGLRIEHTDTPCWVHGDRARLMQALVNYLGNAAKFTDRGDIVLACRLLEEDADGLLVRFEVTDTGIGVTREQSARMFEPFEQADRSTQRKYRGTGLGLSIVKRLAELMNGEVGVDSEAGRGSTFWMTARLQRGASPPPPATGLVQADAEALLIRDFSGAAVLLAEDDPISREVAQSILQSAGLLVECAEDGAQAVALSSVRPYALILMDMQMPRMDGLQATAAIRQQPGRQATPILALTANAFEEDRRRCLEAGMNDFITKPIEPERLCEVVLKWLSIRPGFKSRSSATDCEASSGK